MVALHSESWERRSIAFPGSKEGGQLTCLHLGSMSGNGKYRYESRKLNLEKHIWGETGKEMETGID